MEFLTIRIMIVFCFLLTSRRQEISTNISILRNQICIEIRNNTNDSVFFQFKGIAGLKVSYKGSRISNFIDKDKVNFNVSDSSFDSQIKNRPLNFRIGNQKHQYLIDSFLTKYFIDEFRKLNKNIDHSTFDESKILINVTSVLSFEGDFLFLQPQESYQKVILCSPSLMIPGKYTVCYKEKYKKYFHKKIRIYEESIKKSVKIPIIPPKKIMGYNRFDGELKTRVASFIMEN